MLPAILTRRLQSFRHAFAGIAYTLRTQPNTRLHAAATAAVLILGLWLDLTRIDWALIAVAVASVWAAEILNTALEALVDLVSPDPHPLAKVAKDCAAAAVLVLAGLAVVIGLLVLGPPLWDSLTP
ncbi:MAG: diacylglycerol kinase family protein [Anaerolineae bacterium]|nr:diacylglycerol kinase family protein [Anaerolineae bacterium]